MHARRTERRLDLARTLALVVALALAFAAGAPARASARELAVDGPLGVATESPIRQLFLDVTGGDARSRVAPRVAIRWIMANSWTTPTTLVRGTEGVFLQLDGQADALALAFEVPWPSALRGAGGPRARRLSTTIETRATAWWGGWTDRPVEAWHRIGGFTNFEREDYSAGNVLLTMRSGGEAVFDVRSEGVSLGGVVVRNQLVLAEGGTSLRAPSGASRSRWAVSLRADLKLPLDSPDRLGSSGGTDVGAGLLATAEVAPWLVLHANAFTSAWSSLSTDVPLRPRRYHHGGELSAVFAGPKWAVIVEDRLLSPIFPGEWKRFGGSVEYWHLQASAAFAATRWQNQISVGVRRGRFTAWFSEDFTLGRTQGTSHWFFNSNTPDLSVGVEVAHAF